MIGCAIARRFDFALLAALLAIASSSPVWLREVPPRVAIYADLSPSTRTADWRQPARLREILDALPGEPSLFVFGEAAVTTTPDVYDGRDLPADATRLTVEADVDAAVLLTDGRLTVDSPVPAFLLVDPALDDPGDDAAVELRREPHGVIRRTREYSEVVAEADELRVEAGDVWPENDVLELPPPPNVLSRRIVVGGTRAGFESIDASAVTVAALAGADVVLVESATDGEALASFATDLGGVVIWASSDLPPAGLADALPLSFVPPGEPARWAMLVDVSGSMAGRSAEARAAVAAAGRALPADSRVDVAAFAGGVTWLARDASPSDLPTGLPPTGGATNLDAALAEVGDERRVLAITDAEVEVPSLLAGALAGRGVVVHVLHVGDGEASASVRELAEATGGTFVAEPDPAAWREAASRLARGASSGERREDAAVLSVGELVASIAPWRLAWAKREADDLAPPSRSQVAAATWRVGAGRTVAIAGQVPDDVLAWLVDQYAATPPGEVDVRWADGEQLVLTVIGEASSVQLRRDGEVVEAERVGPSEWRAAIGGVRDPAIAVAVVDGGVVERRATAGRYATEFEQIGNDKTSLLAIAETTGGGVAARVEDLRLPTGRERIDLTVLLALVAAVAAGVVAWRSRG